MCVLCDCPDIGGGRLMWPDQGDAANNLDVAFNWQSSFAPRCRLELPRSARGGGGVGSSQAIMNFIQGIEAGKKV